MKQFILASGSIPRRRLLEGAGFAPVVRKAQVDETPHPGENPENLVCRLAAAKARQISRDFPESVVLGADTIVYFRNTIMGKPTNIEQARQFLFDLSAATHVVYSGVYMIRKIPLRENSWYTQTRVTFRDLSESDIDTVLTTGNPLEKAGGYGIQKHEELLIANYEGLRSNVVGLPVEEVQAKFAEFMESPQ